jgi:hypothetical protein
MNCGVPFVDVFVGRLHSKTPEWRRIKLLGWMADPRSPTKFGHRLETSADDWGVYELHALRTSLAGATSPFHPDTELSPAQLWNSQSHLWHAERAIINALGVTSWNSAIGEEVALVRNIISEDEPVLQNVSHFLYQSCTRRLTDRIRINQVWDFVAEAGFPQFKFDQNPAFLEWVEQWQYDERDTYKQ